MRFFSRPSYRCQHSSRTSRRHFRPQLEALEARFAPAVNAVLNGSVLSVTLTAAGDTATISNNGADVTVNGNPFGGVTALSIAGNAAANQTANLAGTVNLTGDLNVTQITTVNLNGTYTVGGTLRLSLSSLTGGITGNGSFVVTGDTAFSAGVNAITLNGPNDVRGNVRIGSASTVSLTDAATLKLTRLAVQNDATITSRAIDLNGQPHDYSSANKGTLVLQPDSPTASIGIEGGAGTYQVTDQAFDRIGDGFGSLIIGRADGQHVIDIQGLSPKTGTTIRTPAGGSINVNQRVNIHTENVGLTLDSPGGVTV